MYFCVLLVIFWISRCIWKSQLARQATWTAFQRMSFWLRVYNHLAPENIQVNGISLHKLPRDNEPITFD